MKAFQSCFEQQKVKYTKADAILISDIEESRKMLLNEDRLLKFVLSLGLSRIDHIQELNSYFEKAIRNIPEEVRSNLKLPHGEEV